MKTANKTSLFIALLIISARITIAQTLSIGPTIGGNLSTIRGISNTKSLTGLSIGGFANYSINEHFGVSLKIIYSQLGTAFTYNSETTRLNYVQIPLTAVYYFGDAGNRFRPKIFIGPYIGSLLRANNGSGNEILGGDGQALYQKMDIGALAGLGFNYRLKSRIWLNAELGYGKSFGNIVKTANNSYQNSALGVNIGVSFPVSSQ
jgi:Outer membrane protein beta-barrel domain